MTETHNDCTITVQHLHTHLNRKATLLRDLSTQSCSVVLFDKQSNIQTDIVEN